MTGENLMRTDVMGGICGGDVSELLGYGEWKAFD
ncbi:hypothetical protein HRbin01_00688 [archaeon HR01]|nr:hypothetical protein HRbin01_00688 [archaeon HR01]